MAQCEYIFPDGPKVAKQCGSPSKKDSHFCRHHIGLMLEQGEAVTKPPDHIPAKELEARRQAEKIVGKAALDTVLWANPEDAKLWWPLWVRIDEVNQFTGKGYQCQNPEEVGKGTTGTKFKLPSGQIVWHRNGTVLMKLPMQVHHQVCKLESEKANFHHPINEHKRILEEGKGKFGEKAFPDDMNRVVHHENVTPSQVQGVRQIEQAGRR